MIVVRIELWPHGKEDEASPLGTLMICNDGTGDHTTGNYNVVASHAGVFFGKRREPYKTGKVKGFARKLSPYRLLCRALKSIGEV